MKRIIATIVSMLLTFLLITACGGGNSNIPASTPVPRTELPPTQTPEPTPEPRRDIVISAEFNSSPETVDEFAEAIEILKTTFYKVLDEAKELYYKDVNSESFEVFDNLLDEVFKFYETNADSLFDYFDTFNDKQHEEDNIDFTTFLDFHTQVFSLYIESHSEIFEAYLSAHGEAFQILLGNPVPQNGDINQGGTDINPPSSSGSTDSRTPDTSGYDWRGFLKDYEEWVDDYVVFLKKYKENPTDLTLVTESLDLMIKVGEWAEKAEEVEFELEDDPAALKEYIEILTRIIKKLTDAM